MEKHKDPDELWTAFSALCAVLTEHEDKRPFIVPALNVLLSCLRAADQNCGPDFT